MHFINSVILLFSRYKSVEIESFSGNFKKALFIFMALNSAFFFTLRISLPLLHVSADVLGMHADVEKLAPRPSKIWKFSGFCEEELNNYVLGFGGGVEDSGREDDGEEAACGGCRGACSSGVYRGRLRAMCSRSGSGRKVSAAKSRFPRQFQRLCQII